MVGRKSLAEVLNEAINAGGQKLPRPVFKVMKELQENGGETSFKAVKEVAKKEEPPPLDARTAAWNAFSDTEGHKYKTLEERKVAFDEKWRE
jgi:hypothetical protein